MRWACGCRSRHSRLRQGGGHQRRRGLEEVDPQTLESRIQPGLHFAGEVLDLDGLIGGYNFQAAWSTGWLAGEMLSRRVVC